MTGKKSSLWIAAVALLCACPAKAPVYDYSKEPDPRRAEYLIGVSDLLNINVWKNPQLSTPAVVRPDGTITIPLVGDLTAVGKTPTQLKQEIANRVSEYVKLDPNEVTIAVSGVNSYRFTVSGEVASPGIFSQSRYVTVAEAIALAGGFTRFAERNEIRIHRPDANGRVRQIPIAYDFIERGTYPEMNLVLLAGDTLHVP